MRENIIKYTIRGTALIVLVAIGYFLISALNVNKKENQSINTKKKLDTLIPSAPKNDTILHFGNRKVYIKISGDSISKGTLLVLQGWNLGAEEWCTKTELCSKAKAKGYNLVLPDMGKSVYSTKYYPETRKDWTVYPTRKWLTDTIIPELQKKYGLFKTGGKNFLVGLSTGARGVALIALDMPELFIGAAALSGDYDQTQLPGDNLMTGFYGSYYSNKERWETVDNVLYRIKDYKTPTYLGHGKMDKVVPPQQTKLFYDALKKNSPSLKVQLNMPDAAIHDYNYWKSEVDNFLKFFEEIN